MIMFCSKCGSEIKEEGAMFCPNCGQGLQMGAQVVSPVSASKNNIKTVHIGGLYLIVPLYMV